METKEIVKAETKKKEEVKFLKLTLPSKRPVILKSNGSIYGMSMPYGAKVTSPLTKKEIYGEFTGDFATEPPKDDTKLLSYPDKKWLVPLQNVRRWARQLLEYDDESLCVYGVHRKNPDKWLAVVPEQEVSTASVDVDEFGKAVEQLSKLGYRTVGTLHTHPGGMTSCSTTDTGQLWNKFAGIHLIVTHTGIVSFYFSTRGTTWSLADCEGFANTPLWERGRIPKPLKKGSPILLGEDGTSDYDQFITKKTYTYTYTSHKQNTLFDYTSQGRKDFYDTVPYSGDYNSKEQRWEYVRQKDGKLVDVYYGYVYVCYKDKTTQDYHAGLPTQAMLKKDSDRYDIILPSDIKRPEYMTCVGVKQKTETKKEIKSKDNSNLMEELAKCLCLSSVCDVLLDTEDGCSVENLQTRMECEGIVSDMAKLLFDLNRLFVITMEDEDTDENTKKMFYEVSKYACTLENVVWGDMAKTREEYDKIFNIKGK